MERAKILQNQTGIILFSFLFALTMVPMAQADTIEIETENINSIIAPMQIGSDVNASAGRFIHIPNGNGASYSTPGVGTAVYSVNIRQSGTYVVWGRVIALYPDDDSFFVQVDNGINYTWMTPAGNTWHWAKVKDYFRGEVKITLDAGAHTIKIKHREDGTKIDKLILTNDLTLVPTDSVIQAFCGNGKIESGEACDGISTKSCAITTGYTGTQSCQSNCTFGACVPTEYCGDGILQTQAGEKCDDGNTIDGDGCSKTCVVEYCGDGTVQTGLNEECEGVSVKSCTALNKYSGVQSCGSNCHFGLCQVNEYCGDGIVQANEECDDGNQTSGDGCSAGCALEKQKLSGLLDAKGIDRVNQLEEQLAGMSVIATHPRIFLNSTKLAKLRGKAGQAAWNAVLASADKGDMISSALGYLMLEESNPPKAFVYAENVFNAINNMSFINGCSTGLYDQKSRIDVAMAALAFDWVYNGLSDVQRTALINKLAAASDIAAMKKEIDAGVVPRTGPSQCYKRATKGETFHREEWVFYAYEGWPEIALAGHIPDAEAVYKARWDYRWYWGDAARMEAYVNDGTPFEGYYFGNDGVAWFLSLESATGINLIDGADFFWNRDAADYMLYRLDIANSRETMHKGAATSTLSTNSFLQSATDTWKLREHISRSFLVSADKNPYLQWLMNNKVNRFSSWLMTNNYFGSITQLYQISKLLFYDQNAPIKDPAAATYAELPYDRHFDGGNEAYMRTGWGSKSAIVGFRSKPAFTMTSHSDFDVNTFVIYRDGGPLSPDSGVYDAYEQQSNYIQYQKNTVAHNNLLIIDPMDPNGPKKLSLVPDPGGIDLRSTRTFSAPNYFSNSVFVENDPTANWADISKFESHPDYAYLMGDAEEAYGNRLSQYDRNLVFLREKNDEAYLIIFDRVVATNAAFKKKWLLHTVSEPVLNGKIIGTEVPGHIETHDGDMMTAENYEKTSKLHAKFLLPLNHRVRRVSGEILHTNGTVTVNYGSDKVAGNGTNFSQTMVGHHFHVNKDKTSIVPSGYDGFYDWYQIKSVEDTTHLTLKKIYNHVAALNEPYTINQGYQFWVDSVPPKNLFVTGSTKASSTNEATGKVWQHMGQGRIELIPPDGNKTDHFLVAMYASDINSSMPGNVKRLESLSGDEMYGVLIANRVVMFGKTGLPVNGFDFDVVHVGEVSFLITDLVPAQSYVVSKNTNMLSTITASGQGTIYFKDTPGLNGSTYRIQKQ